MTAGAGATTTGQGEGQTAQAEAEDRWGLRHSSVPGLRMEDFPDEETWQAVSNFFRDHQPLRQEVNLHS